MGAFWHGFVVYRVPAPETMPNERTVEGRMICKDCKRNHVNIPGREYALATFLVRGQQGDAAQAEEQCQHIVATALMLESKGRLSPFNLLPTMTISAF